MVQRSFSAGGAGLINATPLPHQLPRYLPTKAHRQWLGHAIQVHLAVLHLQVGGQVIAFSEGWKELTKGTAVATPPTAPAHPDAISHVRLLESMEESLMGLLGQRLSLGYRLILRTDP